MPNIKPAEFTPLVQRYIEDGIALTDDIAVEKVKVDVNFISDTLVTGGLSATVMEVVLCNQW